MNGDRFINYRRKEDYTIDILSFLHDNNLIKKGKEEEVKNYIKEVEEIERIKTNEVAAIIFANIKTFF